MTAEELKAQIAELLAALETARSVLEVIQASPTRRALIENQTGYGLRVVRDAIEKVTNEQEA